MTVSAKDERRSEQRIATAAMIEVRLGARDALKTLWMRDISKRGLFIATDDPPALGTEIDIALSVETAGALELRGLVVHVRRASEHDAVVSPSGVGVQLIDLPPEVEQRLRAYVDGLAEALSDTRPRERSSVQSPAALARWILETEDVYRLLGVAPEATAKEIADRISELSTSLAATPVGVTRAEAVLIQNARSQLTRIARVMSDVDRRMEHDFRRGHFRVGSRVADAKRGGPSLRRCRDVWTKVFRDKIEEAARFHQRANDAEAAGDLGSAFRFGSRALELDPFNEEIRRSIPRWGR
jgi:Tfp pilus assembly protein PilZ